MPMRAIYDGTLYLVGDDLNHCQLLDAETREERRRVDFGDIALIVDPTDTQVEAAGLGLPIPLDPDGYGF